MFTTGSKFFFGAAFVAGFAAFVQGVAVSDPAGMLVLIGVAVIAVFLGGVMVIKGQFADGSPMTAVPNFVRTNRVPPTPIPPANPFPEPGAPRPAPRAPISVVWIKEA